MISPDRAKGGEARTRVNLARSWSEIPIKRPPLGRPPFKEGEAGSVRRSKPSMIISSSSHVSWNRMILNEFMYFLNSGSDFLVLQPAMFQLSIDNVGSLCCLGNCHFELFNGFLEVERGPIRKSVILVCADRVFFCVD